MEETTATPFGEELAVATARAFGEYLGYDVVLYNLRAEPADDGWEVSFDPAPDRKPDPGEFFTVLVTSMAVRIGFGK